MNPREEDITKAYEFAGIMKISRDIKAISNMRENTLVLVQYLFCFDLAAGENFSQHNNVVLVGIDSKNRWQGNQRQKQALSMKLINGIFNNQPINHDSHQQTNRIP